MRLKNVLFVALATACFYMGHSQLNAATYPVVHGSSIDTCEKWAATELSMFLKKIYGKDDFPVVESIPDNGDYILLGNLKSMGSLKHYVNASEVDDPGEFIVKHVKAGTQQVGIICGNNSRGVIDGVYSLLEQKLGYGFYLSSNACENADKGAFSFNGWRLSAYPEFTERTTFNWYNFISGVSSWNLSEYKKWIRQSARMRYTSVMLHAYAWNPLTEFSYKGQTKSVEYLQNTVYGAHWHNNHTKDVRKLIGGELFADEGPVFGADVSKIGYGGITESNRVAATKKMLREVVAYAANTVGIGFNWSFDIDTKWAHPQNIIKTLPPDSRFLVGKHWIARPDTKDGYQYSRKIIETVMKDYPGISTITVWWRHKSGNNFGGLMNNMKESEIPTDWKAEFDAAPAAAKEHIGPANLYYSKVTKAFRRALDELGHKDVKLAYGSWWMNTSQHHKLFASANYFQDKIFPAYVLDYSMNFDKSTSYRSELLKTGLNRKLYVIEWAQHDDGKYMGRPYTPTTKFKDKLGEVKASGFGIIHWTTRPLDIFFKSLQYQIWSNTFNEDLPVTCRKMAEDYFGMSQSDIMTDYLHTWLTTAPQFGRETGKLGKTGIKDHDQRAKECDERIAILDRVNISELTKAGLKRWKYFKGHEEWIKMFHLAQKNWDMDLQKKTIRKFIEKASVDGGMTRGEEGLLIQHNIKWLKKQKSNKPDGK